MRRGLLRLIGRALDRPATTIVCFLLATAAWGVAMPRLYLATDGRSLLPPDHPVLELQRQVDDTFSSADFVVVGLEATAEGDLFTVERLNLLLRLTRELERLEGVKSEEVRSLASEATPAWTAAGLALEPPLDHRLESAEEAAEVARLVRADPLFTRVLASEDGRGAAIYAPIAAGVDRRQIVHRIEGLVEAEEAAAAADGVRLHLLGPTAAESLLGDHVLADLAIMLPASLAVVALILWLWFRQTVIIVVGLMESMVVVAWSLGLMGALGKGISLVTVVMPVILATYCVADTIHVGQRFREKCAELNGATRRQALDAALEEILSPVVFTSLTTCAGFLAFAVSPLPPVRDFGLFCAFGIFCALGTSLLLVPSGLLLWGFGRRREERSMPAAAERLLVGGALAAARRPLTVVAAALLLSAGLGAGALHLEVQDSWVDNFAPGSDMVRSDGWFNDRFFGSNILNVVVDSGAHRGAVGPEFLAASEALQRRLETQPAVGGSRSLADQMTAVGRTLEGEGRLPREVMEAEQWSLLVEMAGGRENLEPYVDDQRSTGNLWVYLNRADYQKTAAAVEAARGFDGWPATVGAAEGGGEAVRFAGDAYLGHLLVELIADSQRASLLAALAVTLLVVWVMLRSLPDAFLVMLPVTLAVLWNFGFMGWSGLPLGVATSTFSAIALGIGVDFALHWRARLRLARRAGEGWEEAVKTTATTTGGAILLHGAVLLCGFAVMMLSSVPPNRRLGLLIAINLVACLAATLVLLPAAATLLVRWHRGWEPDRAPGPPESGEGRLPATS